MIITDIFTIEKETRKVNDINFNGNKAKAIYCNNQASLEWALDWCKERVIRDMAAVSDGVDIKDFKTREDFVNAYDGVYTMNKVFSQRGEFAIMNATPQMRETFIKAQSIFKFMDNFRDSVIRRGNNHKEIVVCYNTEFVNGLNNDPRNNWLVESHQLPGKQMFSDLKGRTSKWDQAREIGGRND